MEKKKNENPIATFFGREDVRTKFQEIMGKKSAQFITSVLQIVSSNNKLKLCDPVSIYNAAAVAATLDLPINNNLGFAYIIPYEVSVQDNQDGQWKKVWQAQFQIGYKGFKQLALRSGQFKSLNAVDVRESEIKFNDRLSGEMEFEWIQNESERLQKPVVGYISHFRLLNGFEHTFYMSIEKLRAHGAKYSKSFNNQKGLWNTDFEGMCIKTVTKLNLSRNAPMSIEMQTAVITDQAVIKNVEGTEVQYVDNEPVQEAIDVDKENERIILMIGDAMTVEDLDKIGGEITMTPEQIELFDSKKEMILNSKK